MSEKPWPAEDDADVPIVSVETAYAGFLSVHHYQVRVPRFEGGKATISREMLERGRSACILPYDPKADKVLLIRHVLIGSFVVGRAPMPLKVVAGIVGKGEDDEAAACREAMEEAGCKIRRIVRAQAFLPTPGGSSERIVALLGEADLAAAGGVHGAAGEDEDIRVEVFDANDAIALLDDDRIECGPAVVPIVVRTSSRENSP